MLENQQKANGFFIFFYIEKCTGKNTIENFNYKNKSLYNYSLSIKFHKSSCLIVSSSQLEKAKYYNKIYIT